MSSPKSICVYCGSSSGVDPAYVEAGRAFGGEIANAGCNLVFGGGLRGIMGAVAEGCRAGGGRVTGIIPRFLVQAETGDGDRSVFDEYIVVDTMHQRKQLLYDRSEAFVALPGGLGTLEEIVEVMTWAQLGSHAKPIVFANVGGFWDPLMTLFDHMQSAGFIHTAHRVRPRLVPDITDILPVLRQEPNDPIH